MLTECWVLKRFTSRLKTVQNLVLFFVMFSVILTVHAVLVVVSRRTETFSRQTTRSKVFSLIIRCVFLVLYEIILFADYC